MITLQDKRLAISLGGIVLILLLAGLYSASVHVRKDSSTPAPVEESKKTAIGFVSKDNALEEIKDSLNELPKSTINGNVYALAWRKEQKYIDDQHLYQPAAILIFKAQGSDQVVVWESEEEISNNGVPRFQDIDTDGVDEVVWEGDLSVSGRTNAFYVYKYESDTFKRISPLQDETNESFLVTALVGEANLTYMKDLDGDGTQEIVVGTSANGKPALTAYKYDSIKYYLWMENLDPINSN